MLFTSLPFTVSFAFLFPVSVSSVRVMCDLQVTDEGLVL